GGGGGGGRATDPLQRPLAQARELLAAGSVPEAVAIIAKVLPTATRPSDRFRIPLEIAKLCLEGGQTAIARPQLDGLDRVAERHRLEEWDPALCADLYAALYAAHRAMAQVEELTPEQRARLSAAFERLCLLDAEAALRMGG